MIIYMDMAMFNQGLVVAGIGCAVVFTALTILWFILELTSKLINLKINVQLKKKDVPVKEIRLARDVNGELTAVIGTAFYLYLEDIHDQENTILTIKRMGKNYSPWSSKIYSVMNLNKRFAKKAS
ncbi:MAG: OadG family protein [Candidatus Cyclobacteriaceae bacterium M3_2C_046]